MKKILIAVVIISGLLVAVLYSKEIKRSFGSKTAEKRIEKHDRETYQNGDIIFQASESGQSKAIQLATKSEYSHCGLIYKEGNELFVFEAVQPVKTTPFDVWVKRGKSEQFKVKRLKNADKVLTPEVLAKMKETGQQFSGKNYDLTFEWSDDRIYCSELVWKVYKNATGLEVGKLQHLRDFDLTNPIVKKKMKERYGNNIPLDELVISPAAIFNSEILVEVQP